MEPPPQSIDLGRRSDRQREGCHRNAVVNQRFRLLQGCIPMHLLVIDFPRVHCARGFGEAVSHPARFLENLRLSRGKTSKGVVRTLARHVGGHRGLHHVRRSANGALYQASLALFVEIGARTEPGFEGLAAFPAVEIEHDHKVTASGIARRWLSAGMRVRTSEMRLRSTLAKPTPCSSPMSSKTSPQGSTTRLWPNVCRPSSWRPTCAAATMNRPASIALARSSTCQWALPVG